MENLQLNQRGLERRFKRFLYGKKQQFLAIVVPGFESIAQKEIESLEQCIVNRCIKGGIEFEAPFEYMYYGNLNLRTVNRVLMRLETFKARSYPELFNKAKRLKWELYIGSNKSISIQATSRCSRLHHTDNISQSIYKGLTSYYETFGLIPELSADAPIRFFVHFNDDLCTISLDTSGDLLYKRGYRLDVAKAPIRETTAAALLMHLDAKNYDTIVDPLCGSGVFVTEAILLAMGIPPGEHRKFSFTSWPSYDSSKWEKEVRLAQTKIGNKVLKKFIANDLSLLTLESAKKNFERAGIAEKVDMHNGNCLDIVCNLNQGERGLLISNLPYGKRIAFQTDLIPFFKSFGMHLNKKFSGWDYGFVTAEPKFPQYTKLKSKKALTFSNGGIPVYFFTGTI